MVPQQGREHVPAGERKQRKDQRAGAISRVISGNRTHQRPVPARVLAGLHDWRDGANGGFRTFVPR